MLISNKQVVTALLLTQDFSDAHISLQSLQVLLIEINAYKKIIRLMDGNMTYTRFVFYQSNGL